MVWEREKLRDREERERERASQRGNERERTKAAKEALGCLMGKDRSSCVTERRRIYLVDRIYTDLWLTTTQLLLM
jgi:hypothetical protein